MLWYDKIIRQRISSPSFFFLGNQQRTEGEAFIYPTGGVGIFGEIGSPDASFRPNQWNRVVVTMGAEQLAPGVVPTPPSGSRRNQYREMMLDESMSMPIPPPEFYRSGGAAPKNRMLTTYINSKKCSAISSTTRGVLANTDGRFAVSTEVS
jgi:hypothetical protein